MTEDTRAPETARLSGIDPDTASGELRRVFDAQRKQWGTPLVNHGIYARRPTIYRGARAMWTGLAGSGLLDEQLVYLLNRRVAVLNGCHF